MNYSRSYLIRFVGIETPPWGKNMGNDERYEQCYDYCELRNAAKDLLSNPEDKEAEKKLSELIKKLKIK